MDNNELNRIIEQKIILNPIDDLLDEIFEKSKIIREGIVSCEEDIEKL